MSVTLPPKSHSKKAYSDERLGLKAPCLKARACLPGRESQHLVQWASPQTERAPGAARRPGAGEQAPCISRWVRVHDSLPVRARCERNKRRLKKKKNKTLFAI